jgi:hypothetical protein
VRRFNRSASSGFALKLRELFVELELNILNRSRSASLVTMFRRKTSTDAGPPGLARDTGSSCSNALNRVTLEKTMR